MNESEWRLEGTRVYCNAKHVGFAAKDVDGYYVWWPTSDVGGVWTEGSLRELAGFLRNLNTDWDAQVARDLYCPHVGHQWVKVGSTPNMYTCANCREPGWMVPVKEPV